MSSSYSDRERQFEEYLRDGITAAKNGQRKQAESLLNRALYLNNADPRPYLWLSATTSDLNEQRDYLEKAVSLDPSNSAARRGLAQVNSKLAAAVAGPAGPDWPVQPAGKPAAANRAPDGLDDRVWPVPASAPNGAAQAGSRAVQCPNCGGRMSFAVQTALLTCEYCGYEQALAPTGPAGLSGFYPEQVEKVLDSVIPTAQGRRWADKFQRVSCEKCGAASLLPPGERSTQCPYCGSNQLIEPPDKTDLIEPNVIVLMKLDRNEAARRVQAWLGKGLFAPDNLLSRSRVNLRPAYYSCWTFDGLLEMRWTCEINEGTDDRPRWVPRNGVEAQFFNDILSPGIKALPARDLERVEPFELQESEAFKPEYLAGWPTLLYDIPLDAASLAGRERLVRQIRPQMYSLIEPGHQKRNVNIGGGGWSNMTFKHVLVPLWTGSYHFQGKEYRLLVNGQTGKVGGEKPSDWVKMIFAGMTALMLLFLLVFLYLLLTNQLPF